MVSGRILRMQLWPWMLLLLVSPGCTPLLTVDDAVSMDGDSVPLVAYVEREHLLGLRSDIKKVPVSFYIDGQRVGRKSTGEGGRAVVTTRMPPNQPEFEARAALGPLPLKDTGRVFHWRPDRIIIAVDIDHTISRTDYDKLIFAETVKVSPPIRDSREVLRELARDYYIVYLTARPRFLLNKTHQWLEEYGFPEGPVVAAPRLRDAIRSLQYKERTLDMLRERWPGLLIGIGNRETDIEAYMGNKMLPIIVRTNADEDDHKTYPGAISVTDWRSVKRFFQANRSILTRPDGIRKVVNGEQLLQQPLTSWSNGDTDEDD